MEHLYVKFGDGLFEIPVSCRKHLTDKRRQKPYIPPLLPSALIITTRSSAIAKEPRDALCQLKSCSLLHSCTIQITFEKACSRQMTLKVTQGYPNCRYLISYISFPVSDLQLTSILHRFRYTITV